MHGWMEGEGGRRDGGKEGGGMEGEEGGREKERGERGGRVGERGAGEGEDYVTWHLLSSAVPVTLPDRHRKGCS